MSKDIPSDKWKHLHGEVKEWWQKLTDEDIDEIDGRLDELAVKLQARYGFSKSETETEIEQFLKDLEARQKVKVPLTRG